ncbi:MAG: FtsQ-type POTRA domain-containing protein [Candidatus Riflebacteria bacterium]|nr:FtsQ-type POTRA domain-containing protein [Candidatus Riflebacteria bacterium]
MSPFSDLERPRRPFFLPARGTLSENTAERIRNRTVRVRLQSLGRLVGPIKIASFVLIMTGLSYFSIVQLKHLFFETSYFEIKNIEVQGVHILKRETILNIAGIAPAMNVLNLDRDEIRARLLTHPVIRDACIELSSLNTLRLGITERTPLLYVKAGTAFMEISDDGVILATNTYGERDLPIITGLHLDGRKVGDCITDHDGFIEARTWVTSLGATLLKGLSELNFSNTQNPYLFLAGGEKVYPKNLDDFRERYVFLCALLDNLKKNNVEPDTLDMRAPNEIVVKPKKMRKSTEGSPRHGASG